MKTNITRAEEQNRINIEYAFNRLSREDWSKQTDSLSNVRIWTTDGKINKE